MANRSNQEVQIRLDKTRNLRLDFNALAEFEGVMNRSFLSYIAGKNENEIHEQLGFREVRAMLWASLLHEDPDLTLRAAGSLVEQADGETTFEKMRYVFSKVLEAFVLMCGPEAKKKLAELEAASQ